MSHPVELILARNLISGIGLAAMLVDPDGVIVFYNNAAGEYTGRPFEEVGPLSREEWNSKFGPFDEAGRVLPSESLPLTRALREGRPANGRLNLRSADEGRTTDYEVSALPLVTANGFQAAIVVFWRSDDDPDAAE